MRLSLSQIWDLWKIVKEIIGLTKRADDILKEKVVPMEKNPQDKPKDETDPKNEYNLNQ